MPSFIAEESLNSIRVFSLDHDRLIQEIHKIATRVGETDENVLKIVLCGSLAERAGVPGSDEDILIILKESDKSFLERIKEWAERFVLDFPLEVFPYSQKDQDQPDVIEAMKRRFTLFKR